MLSELIKFINVFCLLCVIIMIGWYIIWINVLVNIPIVREVCGLDEYKKRNKKN